MLRIASTLSLGLLVLTACPGDDTGTTASGSAGSSTTASDPTDGNPTDTAPPSTTTAGETEMADTTAGMTTESPTTDAPTTDAPTTDAPTTDAPTTDATTTDATTGTSGGVEDCATCVESQCGDELAACMADPACTCFQDCAAMNPGIPGALACAAECNIPVLDLQNAGTVVGALAVCTQENCPICLE